MFSSPCLVPCHSQSCSDLATHYHTSAAFWGPASSLPNIPGPLQPLLFCTMAFTCSSVNGGKATFSFWPWQNRRPSIFTNIAFGLQSNLHVSQRDNVTFILYIGFRVSVKFTKLVSAGSSLRLGSSYSAISHVYPILFKGLLSRGMSSDGTQLESHCVLFWVSTELGMASDAFGEPVCQSGNGLTFRVSLFLTLTAILSKL